MGVKITGEHLSVYTQAFKNKYKIDFTDLYDEQQQATGNRVEIYIPVACRLF